MSQLRDQFEEHGQGQVFRFYDDLSPEQQENLNRQAEAIDLSEIDRLVKELLVSSPEADTASHMIEPADYIPLSVREGDPGQWQQALQSGEQALRDGRVAAFTVAGGQGTRLGFPGPKGTFPVSTVSGRSLFQIFAEKLEAAQRRYQTRIPWFIMTSQENHEETSAFFQSHDWFGLEQDNVFLFPQGMIPAVDTEGKILLADRHRIALSPDGHGGSLRALVRSGAAGKMEQMGIDTLSCFQVDNPLVRCIDPVFIGFHVNSESQLSSKMVEKRDPEEKVGLFCQKDDQTCVIEYSDLSPELQHQTEADGSLRFRAGSIAIHLFDRKLVEKLGGEDSGGALPFHAARKKVPFVDDAGQSIDPEEPNAVKFEMFIFDALPFASNPVVLETQREAEFSPVKNAEGSDSPESSKRDQLVQFSRWMKAAGVDLPLDEAGVPQVTVEISPLFADSEESFREAWHALPSLPEVKDGLVLEG